MGFPLAEVEALIDPAAEDVQAMKVRKRFRFCVRKHSEYRPVEMLEITGICDAYDTDLLIVFTDLESRFKQDPARDAVFYYLKSQSKRSAKGISKLFNITERSVTNGIRRYCKLHGLPFPDARFTAVGVS